MKYIIHLFMCVFSLNLCTQAWAVEVAPQTQGRFFDNLAQLGDVISRRLSVLATDELTSVAMGYSSKLTNTALGVAGALSLCYLMFETIHYLASRHTSAVQIVLDVGIPAILVAAIIGSYSQRLSEMNALLNLLRNLGGDTSALLSNVVKLYTSVLSLVSLCISNAFTAVGDQAWAATSSILSGADSSFLSSLADLIATVLFALFILILVIFGLADIVGLILMGPFLFAVGIAFGPIFIAALVTPWSRNYTARWFGFIVSASVLTGVLGVIIGIAVKIFDVFGFETITQSAEQMPSALHLVIAAVMLLSVNTLIAQAPAIASALTPGSFGARVSGGGLVLAGSVKVGRGIATASRTTQRLVHQAAHRISRISRNQ